MEIIDCVYLCNGLGRYYIQITNNRTVKKVENWHYSKNGIYKILFQLAEAIDLEIISGIYLCISLGHIQIADKSGHKHQS